MTPSGKELRAAEFVLGTLDEPERRQVEIDVQQDAEMATYVDAWSHRLAPMIEFVRPIAPPPIVWRRIEAAIGPAAAEAPRSVVAARVWERLAFWRWTTVGAACTAGLALILLAVGISSPPTTTAVPRVAALSATGQAPSWLVTLDADERRLEARPAAGITVAPGRTLELWLVPADGAPRSLGLLDAAALSVFALDSDAVEMLARMPALAVSLEPEGGSPTGTPTGPVLYQGVLLSP